MAFTIMGGLSVATFLTLFLLPSIYALWHRRSLGRETAGVAAGARAKPQRDRRRDGCGVAGRRAPKVRIAGAFETQLCDFHIWKSHRGRPGAIMHTVCELKSFRRDAAAAGMAQEEIDDLVDTLKSQSDRGRRNSGHRRLPEGAGCRQGKGQERRLSSDHILQRRGTAGVPHHRVFARANAPA